MIKYRVYHGLTILELGARPKVSEFTVCGEFTGWIGWQRTIDIYAKDDGAALLNELLI